MAPKDTQRLDKVISAQTSLSRKDVHKLLSKGQVTVNGEVVRAFDSRVNLDTDQVAVGGQPLRLTRHSYLMMNKPKGVVSATSDQTLPTVVDLVPEELRRSGLFPAGRLDKDTTGFVLLTDDGELAHRILSPRSHVPKTYLVTLDKPVPESLVEAFWQGVELAPEKRDRHKLERLPQKETRIKCKPARLELAKNPFEARVTIGQGMYHQVRRMFAAFDLTVTNLHRSRIGGLDLDPTLEPGACRSLSEKELALLELSIPLEREDPPFQKKD